MPASVVRLQVRELGVTVEVSQVKLAEESSFFTQSPEELMPGTGVIIIIIII